MNALHFVIFVGFVVELAFELGIIKNPSLKVLARVFIAVITLTLTNHIMPV